MSTATLPQTTPAPEVPGDAPRVLIPSPEPGIYHDVPAEDYHRWDAVNKSSLDYVADFSPMHCKYFRDHPPEPTPALVVGSAFHTLALEPGAYAERFVVAGQCEAATKSGSRCSNGGALFFDGHWFCGVKGHAPAGAGEFGGSILTAEQDKQVKAWRDSMMRHTICRAFIEDDGDNEVSIVWDDRETGVRCKARFDMVRAGWAAIGDLKTTQCAAKPDFERCVGDYGYERQAAWYLDGAKAVGIGGLTHFGLLAIEKAAPYAVAPYRITGDTIDLGREQNRRLLRVVANCMEHNHWPGYGGEFADISLAAYRAREVVKTLEGDRD